MACQRQKETIHLGIGTLQGPCCHALSREICSQHFYFIPKITLQGTNLITPICFLHRKDKVRANIEDVAKPRFVSHSGNQSPDVHLLNQVVCACKLYSVKPLQKHRRGSCSGVQKLSLIHLKKQTLEP